MQQIPLLLIIFADRNVKESIFPANIWVSGTGGFIALL